MRYILGFLIAVSFLSACGPEQESTTNEAWNTENDPSILGDKRYVAIWDKLPRRAKLKDLPWVDDYWATDHGGLSYRWNDTANEFTSPKRFDYPLKPMETITAEETASLSPAEKFDLFLGKSDYTYTKMERARTRVLDTIKGSPSYDPNLVIPDWEGLCHAWAPATLHFEEPGPVTLKNPKGLAISFGASDVKALLIYGVHMADSLDKTLGERCDLDFASLEKDVKAGRISQKDFEALKNRSDCADTNAGSFHIALTNQIGLMKKGFVMDVTRDEQVWNHPIFAFDTQLISESNAPSPGAATGTFKEITVKTAVSYVVENIARWQAQGEHGSVTTATYDYRLELDAKGRIIGGSWLSEERPDFIWTQEIRSFQGDFKAVTQIYNASLQQKRKKKF